MSSDLSDESEAYITDNELRELRDSGQVKSNIEFIDWDAVEEICLYDPFAKTEKEKERCLRKDKYCCQV